MKLLFESQPDGVSVRLDNAAFDVLRNIMVPLGEATYRALASTMAVPGPRRFANQAVNTVARASLQLFTDDELRAYQRALGKEFTRRKRRRVRMNRVRRRRARAEA